MIIERVAIDFRCGECSIVRRVDAQLSCTVVNQMPPGWMVHGTPSLGVCVVCDRCAPPKEEPPHVQGFKDLQPAVAQATGIEGPKEKAGREYVEQARRLNDERRERAEENRQRASAARLVSPESRELTGFRERSSLLPDASTAPIPAPPGACPDCGTAIVEGASWRPDPQYASVMVPVHTECLNKR